MIEFVPVIVEWLDARSNNEGTTFKEKDLKKMRVWEHLAKAQTIGWLIKEDKHGIIIANTNIDGELDYIAIPKGWYKVKRL